MVCHAEKMNGFGMGFHIDRQGVYEEDGSLRMTADPEKMRFVPLHPEIKYPELHQWNRGEGVPASGLRTAWKKEVENLSRKPQKNASRFVEFNVSAGGEFFQTLRKQYPDDKTYFEKCEAYFKECRDVLDFLHPAGKTIKWSTHYEETTPHMHVLKMPIIEAPRKLNIKAKIQGKEAGPPVLKYSSGEFLGGIKGLIKLHDELFESVGKKWGLERGESGKDARHTDQAEWQQELSRKDKAVEKAMAELEKRNSKLVEWTETVAEQHKDLDRRTKAVEEEEKKVEARAATVKGADQELGKVKKTLEQREAAVTGREKLVQMKESDFNKVISNTLLNNEGHKVMGFVLQEFRNEIIQAPEIPKFWPEFFKRLPGFVKEIIQDVRQSIKAEKDNTQKHTQTNTQGKGR